jgi:PEP-CTERM motif
MRNASIVALIGFVAGFATLRGDIIPSFAGTSPGSGASTVWNYTINITSDQQVTAGDFFTIYDFGPFVMGSNLQPTGWSFSSVLVTAPPTGGNPPDNPTLENLTWTYTGTATIPTGTHLGNFAVALATSQFNEAPPTRNSYFAAQATRTGDPTASKITNVGQIPVPTAIPEPTTLSLLALAGVGSALRAIRRRK